MKHSFFPPHFHFFRVNRTGIIKINEAGLFVSPHEADLSRFCDVLYGHANQTVQRWTTVTNIGNNKVAYTIPRKAVRKSHIALWESSTTLCALSLACNFTRDKSLTFNSTQPLRLKNMGHVYVSPLCYIFSTILSIPVSSLIFFFI